MRRTWPIPLGIAVVGALAGVAIAGRSDPIGTYVIDATSETAPDTVSPIGPVGSPAATSDLPPVLTADVPTLPPITPAPSTTAVPTTSTTPPTTTAPTTTTSVTTTTAGAEQTLAKADVRLVVANGDGRFNLAGRNGSRLAAAGYTQIDLEDAAKVPATVLYYRPGFDDEAFIVAADLTVPNALLQPLPDTPITSNDALGDIIVVLGPDAPR